MSCVRICSARARSPSRASASAMFNARRPRRVPVRARAAPRQARAARSTRRGWPSDRESRRRESPLRSGGRADCADSGAAVADERQRVDQAPLVPEIDQVQLIRRLRRATSWPRSRASIDLPQTLDAVATGQQQQPAQHAQRRRRDVGVVAVHADAELRVVHAGIERQRALERVLDALAVARGGQPLARAARATARARRTPRRGRTTPRPAPARASSTRSAAAIARSTRVENDASSRRLSGSSAMRHQMRQRLEQLARFRRGAAGTSVSRQQRDGREIGVEDGVVDRAPAPERR